jgi:hypothetical protein
LKLTFICKVTFNDLAISTSDDDMSFQVDNWNQIEEGSSGVGNLGNHNAEQVLKDRDMPDGDACRPDGTLKDASELEWPNSPSDLPETSNNKYIFLNLKRDLPCDSSNKDESSSASDGYQKNKGQLYFHYICSSRNLPKLRFQHRSNRVLDSDDKVERVGS